MTKKIVLATLYAVLWIICGGLAAFEARPEGIKYMIAMFFFFPSILTLLWMVAYRMRKKFGSMNRFLRVAIYSQVLGIAIQISAIFWPTETPEPAASEKTEKTREIH